MSKDETNPCEACINIDVECEKCYEMSNFIPKHATECEFKTQCGCYRKNAFTCNVELNKIYCGEYRRMKNVPSNSR